MQTLKHELYVVIKKFCTVFKIWRDLFALYCVSALFL